VQFLSISQRLTDRFSDAEFAALGGQEMEQARALFAQGAIRQIWSRVDKPGACILFEAESVEQVNQLLMTLPLYQAGMIDFTIIPLKSYAGFAPRGLP
jgi:muconolactone delta-isomerase